MTRWYEDDEKLLDFLKFLVDTGLISTEQELLHFAKNSDSYTQAYDIYAKEIKGEIIDKIDDIRK